MLDWGLGGGVVCVLEGISGSQGHLVGIDTTESVRVLLFGIQVVCVVNFDIDNGAMPERIYDVFC